jgi:cytochrome P450
MPLGTAQLMTAADDREVVVAIDLGPSEDLAQFDQFDPAYLGWGRYELLASMRERETPVAVDAQGFLWLLRYDDVSLVLADKRAYRASGSDFAVALGLGPGDAWWEFLEYQLITANPPDHTRIREAASFFSKYLVRDLEPMIRETCNRLIDAFPDEGTVEFSYEFAFKLPVGVIMRMLNLPAEDEELIRENSPKAAGPVDTRPETIAATNEANQRLRDYIEAVIAERRVKPIENDIVSELAKTQAQGDVSPDELWSLIVALIVAGHETTTSTLALGLHTLLANRDQLELLRSDPSLLRNAGEEMLRYEAPIAGLIRIPNEDVVFHGVTVPKDRMVMLSLASAGRDPRMFPDPDRFDVTRSNARRHLTFGSGIHRCIGAPLAQLEIPIALGTLFDRLEVIEPAGEPQIALAFIRGYSELPLHVKRKS